MSAQPISDRTTSRFWLADNWKALLAVWAISLLPFLPVLFAGETLLSFDQMGAGAWRWYFEALRSGEFPLWNPYGFGGMPTYDAMFGDGSYPFFLLLGFLLPVTHVVTYNFVLHVLIAGFTSYFLAQRYFRLSAWVAAPLAIAWAMNPHFISYIYGGHTGKFHIMAWLPLSVYFLLRSLGPNTSWRHLAGLSLTTALFALANHPQFTYFVMMGYFVAWVFFLVPELRSRRFATALSLAGRFWLPILLGIGLAFFIFYPPTQYTKSVSIRGSAEKTTFEHATSWSMHPEETASLLIPEFGGVNERYWGRNPFKLNTEAPGTLVWFLGIFGLLAFRKSRWYWLWGTTSLLAILYGLAAHTPLFRLFYEFVPGIKNFRAASMMLFWLSMGLLLMAAETVRRLSTFGSDSVPDARKKVLDIRLRKVGWSMTGLLVLCGFFPGAVYGIWGVFVDEASIANLAQQPLAQSAFTLGAFRVAALVGLLTWATSAFLLRHGRPMAFGLVALVVVVTDAYWVNSHFIKPYRMEPTLAEEPAVTFIKSDKSAHRVFGLPGAWERWYSQHHGIETVDGWADNEMSHYRAYRGGDYQRNPNFFHGLEQRQDGRVSGSVFLDMLNVKYLVFRVQNEPGLKLVENASVLPRAWFVTSWEKASDEEALTRMRDADFDPRKLVYVDDLPPGGGGGADGAREASIRERERTNNRQTYEVTVASEGVLVVSEAWFPHWRVRVDGERTGLLRANAFFRGVKLEPGTHEVEFEYRSPWLARGVMVAGGSALMLAILCIGFAAVKKRRGMTTVRPLD